MYEEYFGLEKRPFAATPDVSCAYLPESVQEVLNELLLRVEAGQGIALLTAPAGTGKTFLCRRLATELSEQFAAIFIGSSNFPTRRALFQAILYELGANYSGLGEQELRLALQSHLKKLAHSGQALLLILDEAHLLNARLLEEVRSLSDLSENGQPLLRILVSGQPVLEERLTSPESDAFNQRLACHVFLEPFTRAQSREYVAHRIRWAGGNPETLFTSDALDLVAHGSNGVPRCINQLCDHSLLLTFVAELPQVTRTVVEDALTDLKQLPLHWNDALPAAGPLDSLRDTAETAPEEEQLVDELVAETPVTPDIRESPVADERYAFEVGAEPEEYQLSEVANSSTNSGSEQIESEPAVELSAEEIAPPEKDQTLTGLPEISSIPFRTVIPQRRSESRLSDNSHREIIDRGWEPVVEDIVPDALEDATLQTGKIKPLDPSRHGVVPLLDLPRNRFAGFQDEVVVDRYATIDADVRAKPGNSLSAPQFNPTAGIPRGHSDLPGVPEVPESARVVVEPASLRGLPPDQLIDQLMPLLDAAVDSNTETTFLDAARVADSQDSLPSDAEPEEAVGSDVLDLCLEVQDFFTEEMAQPAPSAEVQEEAPSMEAYETPELGSAFDVIEPEPETTRPTAANRFIVDQQHTATDEDETGARPLVPRPNYRRIFSMLRRKLGR